MRKDESTSLRQLQSLVGNQTLVSSYLRDWYAEPVPIDMAQVGLSLRELYAALDLPAPAVVTCESPFQLMVAPILVDILCKTGWMKHLRQSLHDPLWARSFAKLTEQLDDSVYKRIGKSGIGLPLEAASRAKGFWNELVLQVCNSAQRRLGFPGYAQLRTFLPTQAWQKERDSKLRLARDRVRRQLMQYFNASTLVGKRGSPGEESGTASGRRAFKKLEDELLMQIGDEAARAFADRVGMRTGQDGGDGSQLSNRSALHLYVAIQFAEAIKATTWQFHSDPWLPAYAFPLEVIAENLYGEKSLKVVQNCRLLMRYAPLYLLYSEICFVCEDPTYTQYDERARLHSASRAALSYSDGFELYSWHGMSVPDWLIREPEKVTLSLIDSERNVEMRRAYIERFGEQRYLMEGGAHVVHEDDYGTLYRKEMTGDEPLVMVRVANSTAAANGSRPHYFLRVPPNMRTAREAVAWTFNMTAHEYHPKKQT